MENQPRKIMDIAPVKSLASRPSPSPHSVEVKISPPSASPTQPPQTAAADVPEPGMIPKFGELQSKIDSHPLFSGQREPAPRRKSLLAKTLWPVISLLVVIVLLYLAIDSGLIRTNINLPVHIFKQTTQKLPEINTSPSA